MTFHLLYALAFAAQAHAAPVEVPSCQMGGYASADGQVLVLFRMHPEKGPDEFRYKFVDGRGGRIDQPDAAVHCQAGAVSAVDVHGFLKSWRRQDIRETRTLFRRDGTTFSGLLLEPLEVSAKPPLTVMISGSEHYGAVGTYQAYLIAAQGITTFVYDKRGTGRSSGEYTQNFAVLGRDAAAAMAKAQRLVRGRYSRSGFFGGSQAGWVAPLAARISHADFDVVGFGMVLTPLEEDAEQVFDELRGKGYGDDVLAKAREVTRATGLVRASHFRGGFDQVEAVRGRYGREPWFAQMEGEYTGDILRTSEDELRRHGESRFPEYDIDWHYDALGLMRQLSIPQLWIIAGSDRDAPNRLTLQRLADLKHAGKPIQVMVFPHTDHGIVEFTETAAGARTLTRTAEGYYRMVGDWIRGEWHPPYGKAVAASEDP